MAYAVKELRGLKETYSEYDLIEARIKRAFLDLLYKPLVKALAIPDKTLKNSLSPLLDALADGRLTYSRGSFRGRFDAKTSRELRSYGAVWDRKSQSYVIDLRDLPPPIRSVVGVSAERFEERLQRVDREIAKILPAEIADSVKTVDLFDSTLWKINRDVNATLKGITIPFTMTEEGAKKISEDWQHNLNLFIKDFAEEEIPKLREAVLASTLSGNRYESLTAAIEESYGVTRRKAKFLARQETALMVTKFKETRYTEAGISEYRWQCVAGSANHPVRSSHKKLDGSIHKWDDPPITSDDGEPTRRNNPGQDYNCRCIARPIVRFQK